MGPLPDFNKQVGEKFVLYRLRAFPVIYPNVDYREELHYFNAVLNKDRYIEFKPSPAYPKKMLGRIKAENLNYVDVVRDGLHANLFFIGEENIEIAREFMKKRLLLFMQKRARTFNTKVEMLEQLEITGELKPQNVLTRWSE